MSVRSLTLMLLVAAAPVVAQQSKQERAKSFTLDSVAPPEATPTPEASPTPDATPPVAAPVLAAPVVPENAMTATPAEAVPSPAAEAAPTPETPAAANAPAAPSNGLRASFTLDTPIADLIADPAAKAVLDKDLPGISADENLDKFAKLGLRQFQPLTGGQLTDALLVKVARDLAKLSGPMLAPVTPTSGGTSKRNKDESR